MATGKIFKESSNIYDDEARILFNYYKKAAEKIVSEEINIEEKVKEAEDLKESSKEREKSSKIKAVVFAVLSGLFMITGAVLLLLGLKVYLNNSMTASGSLCAVFFLVFVIAMAVSLVKKNQAKKDFEDFENRINDLAEQKKNIRRDYKVKRLGVAYVPVAAKVPFEGKSFTVDYTGSMPQADFSLSVLKQPEELQKSLSRLESSLDNIPLVEGNKDAEVIDTSSYSKSVQSITMHDYMGSIDREVRNISYLLTDSETKSVSLPVVPPESDEKRFLDEYATADTNGKPVVKVFNTDGFENRLKDFSNISDIKKELEKNTEKGSTEYFKSLIKKLGDTVQTVSKLKTSSTTSIIDYTNSILSAVLKAGCNQYSPALEAEELERLRSVNFNYQDCVESYKPFELKESSKVRYDIYNKNWVAEDNTRTILPFGINQIEEEVLMPLINNLMNETRIERLNIYNSIKDQKTYYLKEWHKEVEDTFRDNRSTGQELITQITKAYAEYSTAHNTYLSYKETQGAMESVSSSKPSEENQTEKETSKEETVKEIEEKVENCKQIGDAFQLYIRNLYADIEAVSQKFGFVEYFEGSLRDGESKKAADSIVTENIQNLSPRRQKIIPISSYIASYADLPPEPSTEETLMQDFSVDLQALASSEIERISEEGKRLNSQSSEDENAGAGE